MSGQSRLFVLTALVMSLLATLAARAFDLTVLQSEQLAAAAANNRLRDVVVPAARGMILDQRGRPLVTNRIELNVTADRRALSRQPNRGLATLTALAEVVDVSAQRLADRVRNCGTVGAADPPDCWNGPSAADPILVRDVAAQTAARITENPSRFPGIKVTTGIQRQYPHNQLAAQVLGYVAEVDAADVAADPNLNGRELIGRAGLEQQYEQQLSGTPGTATAQIDSSGHHLSSATITPAIPGQVLVTSLDVKLQQATEDALTRAMSLARSRVDHNTGTNFRADSGSAVVLDVRTGKVLALASAPGYDANDWVGGISSQRYSELTDPQAGQPLLNRSIQAQVAPASTFKVVSAAAAMAAGYSPWQGYPCPSSYRAGGRAFRNYESRAYGPITFARALEVSCDTVFYGIAHQFWAQGSGADGKEVDAQARDAISNMATSFGFGQATGIDLPGERPGQVASQTAKQAQWDAKHILWCKRAETGYPEVADAKRAQYLQALAQENCAEGMIWRVGDAVNAAIGQGDTLVTPLQLAVAYAAIANGGTRWQPQIGLGLLNPDGSVATAFPARAAGSLPLDGEQLRYLRTALRGVIERGTARRVFADFPTSQIPLAGKTGTAEVYGKQTTSWFASFAPADNPRYAVVAMVSQAGTGAGTAGRAVKWIYEAIFGVQDGVVGGRPSVLIGGDVAATLPTLTADGLPVAPADSQSQSQRQG